MKHATTIAAALALLVTAACSSTEEPKEAQGGASSHEELTPCMQCMEENDPDACQSVCSLHDEGTTRDDTSRAKAMTCWECTGKYTAEECGDICDSPKDQTEE